MDSPCLSCSRRDRPRDGFPSSTAISSARVDGACRNSMGEHSFDAVCHARQRDPSGEDGVLHGGVQLFHRPTADSRIARSRADDEAHARQ